MACPCLLQPVYVIENQFFFIFTYVNNLGYTQFKSYKIKAYLLLENDYNIEFNTKAERI